MAANSKLRPASLTRIATNVTQLVLTMSLLACGTVKADNAKESRAAAALFERFETVAHTKPGLLTGSPEYSSLPKQVQSPLQLPFHFFLQALDAQGAQVKSAVLESAEAIFVGAKDFRAPAGLGPVHSQRCYVVILREQAALDLSKYFRQAAVSSVTGASIWNWSAKTGEFGEMDSRPSSFYITKVANSFLLLSNNLNELKAIAERLVSKDESSGILGEIREWESVRQHEVWGYRRYRHKGIVDRTAAGMANITPEAQALIVMFDRKENNIMLRLFCVPGEERTPVKINSTGLFGRLHWQDGGIWYRAIPFVADLETLERVSEAMNMLGFGYYV